MVNKKKKYGILIALLLIVSFFVFQGLLFGWFFPPKPAIVVHLARNTTEILGFTYAKNPGSLMCIACDGFSARGSIVLNNKTICETSNGYIGLGETYMPLLCPRDISKYEGETVEVAVIGSVNKVEKPDHKTLKLEFKKKDDFRS